MNKETIYIIVGTLVVANIGTIITVLISALKLAAKFGEMDTKVKRNSKDINAAHERIRSVEQRVPTINN